MYCSSTLHRLSALALGWIGMSLSLGLHAQGAVDHWEAAVQDGTSWTYLVPTAQPSPAWMQEDFAASGWSQGPSGIGYGDGDDATVVGPTTSVYMRHTFDVADVNDYSDAVFAMDYDDGYVAYLNAC